VKRALAAAALCAAASCHTEKRDKPGAVPAPRAAPAAVEVPRPTRDFLAQARARRARLARAEQEVDPDTAAIATEAQACAADAHRSWAAQYPEAAAARDPVQGHALLWAPGAEALYLEAVCTEIWARMQGFTPLIERRRELISAFTRVSQLAPDLDGAGAERELGAVLAGLPTYAGGDLEEARAHLMAAVARAPRDARNHLVLARTVAVKAQDRALFREQLQHALASEDSTAVADAQALLQREEELFGPAEAAQPIPGGPQR
jgi:hypothetical protein